VWSTILEPMLQRYYPPFYAETDEELLQLCADACVDYVRILAEYSYTTLKAAWLRTISQHKTERWPTPGAFVDACGVDVGLGSGRPAAAGRPLAGRASSERGLIWRADAEELKLYQQAGGIFSSMTMASERYLQMARDAIAAKPVPTPDRKRTA
jgi:hypothetical protein